MKGDLGEAFEKLKKGIFVPYRGAFIETPATPTRPYRWNGRPFMSLTDAKNAVDESYKTLEESIKKP